MDFLKELGIKFIRDYKITGLKGDTKHFRLADFYLPKFDAYIEFYGLWSKNVKDDDYKLKKVVYRNNGIACVYLYPENLGVIHYSFDKRLQKQLIENGKFRELKKYHWFKFFKTRNVNIGYFSIFFTYLFYMIITYQNTSGYNEAMIFSILVILFQSYRILTAYNSIFVKMKFSLLKVMGA